MGMQSFAILLHHSDLLFIRGRCILQQLRFMSVFLVGFSIYSFIRVADLKLIYNGLVARSSSSSFACLRGTHYCAFMM